MSVEPKNILILRLSSIGDILLTTAFLRQVRNKYPDAKISYIVKQEFQDLLKYNPHINNLIPFDSSTKMEGLKALNLEFCKKNFDFIFDLHNNLRTNRMHAGIEKKKIFKIKKSKVKRAILVYLKLNMYKSIKTIPQRYFEVGHEIEDDGQGLELFLGPGKPKKFLEFDLTENRYICIGPGAAHFTKMWPEKNFEELAEKIVSKTGYKVAILGSAHEKNLLNGIQENEAVVNLCGKLNLLESAEIISTSAGIISNDSGLMHMTAALNKPLLAIFGSTVEELGFFPFRADATILQNKLWCRPCSHIGRKSCPLGHFNCMHLTTPQKVFKEVKRKLIS
ncbi:MAG: lipopolysaccharide heptosyltransferase II [Calditrichaeota bacterium]|nr:MAG: lipopolysaccharide heptosyltransferase II [Calditrichota bacterium]MBL1205475.1 lipopolysaccharide heptosyltransferase II [Calditrichota bacterium]NOG45304.1 lipopolysaccharide heptosyltransferase II [Calditrichota bacterium]